MNNHILVFDSKGIATGNVREDYKSKKKFITDFHAQWIASNTTKHIYNKSLNSFIEVKYLSINETSGKEAYNYKTTLVVTFLTEILENSKVKKDKKGNAAKIQLTFALQNSFCKKW
jgi:hypothetical protein